MTNAASGPPETAFLRRLVHDLRGPVSALRDLPLWLREDVAAAALPLPPDAERLLPLIAQNAAKLDALLEGLATWIAAADAPVARAPSPDPVALLSRLPARGPIEVSVRGPHLPLAAADLALIGTQVLANTARFHPGPEPKLWVSSSQGGAGWDLTFRDDGPGPQVAEPGRLVAPLARASVGAHAPGAGFGLAIVAQVTARYGAELSFGRVASGQGAELRLKGPPRFGETRSMTEIPTR